MLLRNNKYCVDIQNSNTTIGRIGRKAYYLGKASHVSKLSKGFVITSCAYRKFIDSNGIDGLIEEHISKVSNGKESIKKMSDSLKGAILESKFPSDLRKCIYDCVDEIAAPYIVRSSSTVEDSKKHSFAGLFKSIQNVKRKELSSAIKEVFASLFNKNAISYALDNGIRLERFEMPVLVQEMVNRGKFGTGIMFGNKNRQLFIIESVLKASEGVTSGSMAPDIYVIRNGRIDKHPAKNDLFSLFEFELHDIINLIERCSKITYPLYTEWAIDRGCTYLLQLKHMTTRMKLPSRFDRAELRGIPTHSKNASGRAVVWKQYKNKKPIADRNDKNRILVTDILPIWNIGIMKRYGGLVTEFSGITSHAAILSREYGIPCIVGVENATDLIHNRDMIELHGKTGLITIQNRRGVILGKNSSLNTFDIKNMDLFISGLYDVVLYHGVDFLAVSHPFTSSFQNMRDIRNDTLKHIVENIQKHSNVPIIDGGSRLWKECELPLAFSKIDKDVRSALNKGICIMDSIKNAVKVLDKEDYAHYRRKIEAIAYTGMGLMYESQKSYNKYIKSGERDLLVDAAILFFKGFAYWKIFNSCIMDIIADDIIVHMDGKSRKMFERFIRSMWDYDAGFNFKPMNINTFMKKLYKETADLGIRDQHIIGYLKALKNIVK